MKKLCGFGMVAGAIGLAVTGFSAQAASVLNVSFFNSYSTVHSVQMMVYPGNGLASTPNDYPVVAQPSHAQNVAIPTNLDESGAFSFQFKSPLCNGTVSGTYSNPSSYTAQYTMNAAGCRALYVQGGVVILG